MSDADTPPRGLTTDQIAAGGAMPDQDNVLTPDDHGYDDTKYDGTNNYDDAPFATDQATPGYVDHGVTDPVNDRSATGAVNGSAPFATDQATPGYVDHGVTDPVNDRSATGAVNGGATGRVNGGVAADSGARASLLDDSERQSMTMRWKDIQAEFVDEPAEAVQEADALVAELMQRLAAMFSTQRAELETRLASDNEVSTEDLRQGLRRYRSFFERLLAA
jgi:hypothetical protein